MDDLKTTTDVSTTSSDSYGENAPTRYAATGTLRSTTPRRDMNSIHVLDTSVLVHDPKALFNFRDTNVAIPIFVVMELDELKNSRRLEVAAAARWASRIISELREFGPLTGEGVTHPDLNTNFRIVSDSEMQNLGKSIQKHTMDRLIIKSALTLQNDPAFGRVVMISKDVNLRILAEFEGLLAEDYDMDRVELSDVYEGYRVIEDFDPNLVQLAYSPDSELLPSQLGLEDLFPNEFVVCRNGRELLLQFNGATGALEPVAKDFKRVTGIDPRNVEQRMALSLLLDPKIKLVSLIGRAGTGKTFLALAAALAQLNGARGAEYQRILLSKPVVAMGNDIGYLPGDFDAKMHPWMASFFDNLDQLIPTGDEATNKGATKNEKVWEHLFNSNQLEVQAIHTIRGRSIPQSFMVIDEVQNLTPHEVKTIITRAAAGTKVVIAGDPYQVDNHFLDQHSNGLTYVTERMKISPISGTVFFTKGERSELAEAAATLL